MSSYGAWYSYRNGLNWIQQSYVTSIGVHLLFCSLDEVHNEIHFLIKYKLHDNLENY